MLVAKFRKMEALQEMIFLIESSSVYISIYTCSHETQQLYIISSDI